MRLRRLVFPLTHILGLLMLAWPAGLAAAPDSLDLRLQKAVFLDFEGVYNLSGISASPDGWVYVSDDHGPSAPDWSEDNPVLLKARMDRILAPDQKRVKLERVEPSGMRFDFAGAAARLGKHHKFDLEGVMVLPGGNLRAVDERDRLMLEFKPASGKIDRIAGPEELIQPWPELLEKNINTALEGLAVIGDRLFIAWEMRPSLVLAYRMKGGALSPEKKIAVENTLDLNDLSADNGFLYALGRTNGEVYKIDPESGKTLSVARFKVYADSSAYRYANHPEYYNSEGLTVTGKHILVVLDGNMQVLGNGETAPLLFVFRRPEGF